jgi:hypothetical protein
VVGRDLLLWRFGFGLARLFGSALTGQVKQVLLAFTLDDPFPPSSMDPPLVPGELLQNGRVLLPKFFIRDGCFVQHALKFAHTRSGLP